MGSLTMPKSDITNSPPGWYERPLTSKVDDVRAFAEADRKRVADAIRRTAPGLTRIDINAQMKRRGETDLEWRQRLDNIIAGRPFGEPLIPEEAERKGYFVDCFVTHVETNTKAATKRNNLITALDRMFEDGQLTAEQYQAAGEIQLMCETIQRQVGIRGASLKARVDNEGANRDALIESLGRVRLEVLYSRWRDQLPVPKQMYLDIIVTGHPLKGTSRSHGQPWRKVRKRMIDALDRWNALRERVWSSIERQEVESIYWRLGCGTLVGSKE